MKGRCSRRACAFPACDWGGGALGKGGGVLRAAALAHLPGGGEGAAAEN